MREHFNHWLEMASGTCILVTKFWKYSICFSTVFKCGDVRCVTM